jgi:hypothetical protein
MCSYHLCIVCSHVSTFTYILRIFQECDITGGDIKRGTSIGNFLPARQDTALQKTWMHLWPWKKFSAMSSAFNIPFQELKSERSINESIAERNVLLDDSRLAWQKKDSSPQQWLENPLTLRPMSVSSTILDSRFREQYPTCNNHCTNRIHTSPEDMMAA